MNNLPSFGTLPVELLSACFQNATTSYKFYWFLAILEHIKTGGTRIISIDELKSTMIAKIWYPTVYFKLSFGKQDRLSLVASMLNPIDNSELSFDSRQLADSISISRKEAHEFAKEFSNLGRYVPYRFLEPFFRDQLSGLKDDKKNGLIADLAEKSFTGAGFPSIYRFVNGKNGTIEIHANWYDYLLQHIVILEEYCLWNLLNFLQVRNPNVPNIAGKLFPSRARNLTQARQYWIAVLQSKKAIRCIYSKEAIAAENLSLDHFLPWRYVTHDLLWNIIPTLPQVNSSKGDRLPNFVKYFDNFSQIQFNAIQAVATSTRAKSAWLEDYILLFACESWNNLINIPYDAFHDKLYETLAPQFQIARSMGFAGNWSYSPNDLSVTTKP